MTYVIALIDAGRLDRCHCKPNWHAALFVACKVVEAHALDRGQKLPHSKEAIKDLLDINGVYEFDNWSVNIQEALL